MSEFLRKNPTHLWLTAGRLMSHFCFPNSTSFTREMMIPRIHQEKVVIYRTKWCPEGISEFQKAWCLISLVSHYPGWGIRTKKRASSFRVQIPKITDLLSLGREWMLLHSDSPRTKRKGAKGKFEHLSLCLFPVVMMKLLIQWNLVEEWSFRATYHFSKKSTKWDWLALERLSPV